MKKVIRNVLICILAVGLIGAAAFAIVNTLKDNKPENPQDAIAASGNHAMVIRNGSVKVTGKTLSFPKLGDIKNARQIDANGFLAIIDKDGKVKTNSVDNDIISGWEDIKKVTVGYDFIVGLKNDGTLAAAGGNEFGQTGISKAKDVVTVSAGAYHYVGITKSGEVFYNGSNDNGECNVRDWTDIADVECGPYATVGLKKDGTVISTITNVEGYDVSGFTDVKKVVTSKDHTVALKNDGTVIATGNNEFGQCDVSDWTDIVAIKANKNQTIGLKNDGTVVAAGDNSYGQCDAAKLN